MPQRAYRCDLRCSHCGSSGMPQDGTSRGKQTYRYRYPEAAKSQAASMYPGGSGSSAIGRDRPASLEAVYYWIKKAAQARAILNLVRERPAMARPKEMLSGSRALPLLRQGRVQARQPGLGMPSKRL